MEWTVTKIHNVNLKLDIVGRTDWTLCYLKSEWNYVIKNIFNNVQLTHKTDYVQQKLLNDKTNMKVDINDIKYT